MTNVDTNNSFQTEAELIVVTDHAYFWMATGAGFEEADLIALANRFSDEIYPTNREFFGSEWYSRRGSGSEIVCAVCPKFGIFLWRVIFLRQMRFRLWAHEYSNAHEMFVMNIDNLDLTDEFTPGVLAHEFQHMIHWATDRNEETWLNEGFAELAMFLNGLDTGGSEYAYIWNTDYQLNDWPNSDNTDASYGAAFIFVTYFLDRFGDKLPRLWLPILRMGWEALTRFYGISGSPTR